MALDSRAFTWNTSPRGLGTARWPEKAARQKTQASKASASDETSIAVRATVQALGFGCVLAMLVSRILPLRGSVRRAREVLADRLGQGELLGFEDARGERRDGVAGLDRDLALQQDRAGVVFVGDVVNGA